MEVLKDRIRRIEPIQFVVSIIFFIIAISLSYVQFQDKGNRLYALYLFVIVGVVLGAFIWNKAISKYFSKFIFYLLEHKYFRKIIAGGSFSYYGYKDPESINTKSKLIDPIKQVISLLLAFVGISVFFMGFLSEDATKDPLIWGLFTIIVPIIATPLVPVLWALEDANVKGYAKGNDTTWMVSKKYKNRYNSIITIAAIFSNLKDSSAGDIIDQIKLFLGVIKIGILVMLISTSIFVIIYYGWFNELLRDNLRSSVNLTTYEVVLVEHEGEAKLEKTDADEKDDQVNKPISKAGEPVPDVSKEEEIKEDDFTTKSSSESKLTKSEEFSKPSEIEEAVNEKDTKEEDKEETGEIHDEIKETKGEEIHLEEDKENDT